MQNSRHRDLCDLVAVWAPKWCPGTLKWRLAPKLVENTAEGRGQVSVDSCLRASNECLF